MPRLVALPGDGWRIQHDALKWRIFEDAKEMGARCRVEVFGLFAACLPQAGRAQAGDMPARKRQGMVPDFLFTLPFDVPEGDLLIELKTLRHEHLPQHPRPLQRSGAKGPSAPRGVRQEGASAGCRVLRGRRRRAWARGAQAEDT